MLLGTVSDTTLTNVRRIILRLKLQTIYWTCQNTSLVINLDMSGKVATAKDYWTRAQDMS